MIWIKLKKNISLLFGNVMSKKDIRIFLEMVRSLIYVVLILVF